MPNIETPPILAGNEAEQLRSMYRYLMRLADQLNDSLGGIGGNDFTDSERKILNGIIEKPAGDGQTDDMQTLKSWIIKTAEYTQSTIEKIRKNLVSESVAEGQFGRYVRRTELEAEVTPEGITQNYSFEELVQALQTYTVNAKNYIKSGLLREVGGLPVDGIAVGKDIVTFAQDGTETYNDSNKVAEFTADELSFWQNGSKVAGYTGNRISFYYGGAEVFYILNGKIYCANDLELASGKKLIINTENFKIDSTGKVTIKGDGEFSGDLRAAGGTFSGELKTQEWIFNENGIECYALPIGTSQNGFMTIRKIKDSTQSKHIKKIRIYIENPGLSDFASYDFEETKFYATRPQSTTSYRGVDLGDPTYKWGYIYGVTVDYENLVQSSSRDKKMDIQDMPEMGEKLDGLRPVTFRYREDPDKRKRFGLIYEEARPVLPEICTANEGGKGVSYMELVPMLLKEVQELRKRVAALEAKG